MPVQTTAQTLRQDADALAAGYPALLAEADRVAALVAAGVHGRRRAGQGETFWQYRPYDPSDSANRIDWRRSARSDAVFVRDTEWEAANSLYIWRDGGPGMDWRSSKSLPTKKDRASVLTLAIASLLTRAGERIAILGESERPRSGRVGYERLAQRLALSEGAQDRLNGKLPAHAKLLLASDFLTDPDGWPQRLAALAARPASGIILHIIDPAEESFPFKGRIEFATPGGWMSPYLLGRAERAREDYRRKFEAHSERLTVTARQLGFTLIRHRTDQPPGPTLTALYQAFERSS
ncbi:DUF58 domain-containing protein [Algimonas porphyrae]|uniref:DUF58 domain-containing protein n=1 Tax=Algimonas porphyrae TaxID=1128113 RepID=A0ABQ5UZC8_9PROT|nr:DUF58 domain-containing protein [Algimonas porphyrae]GLQ20125.1 hypothetical protein GCM10007854_10800 [Algimonas porphyrae]